LVSSLVVAGALVVVAVVHLGVDISTLWSPRARALAADLVASSVPPDLGSGQLVTLARLSLETLSMAIVATALAWTGGLALAFAAAGTLAPVDGGAGGLARRGLRRVAAAATRGFLLVCRAVPPPVGALLVLFVLFPGPLPGALALAVYNLGILGRLMAEVVDNLDARPVRALRSSGAAPTAALLYGALPRALPRFATYGLYRWEVTIRETVVVGLVGAGGLGRLLAEQVAAFDHRGVMATLLALVALTVAVDLAGAAARRALR
jgi:phosphonate transport system permease protein